MLKVYILILVLFLVIDLPVILWLNKDMYKNLLDKINGNTEGNTTNKIIGAIIAYVLLALAIYYFIVMPAFKENTLIESYYNIILKGCILGLVIYGVYDGTNLATINNFGMKEAIADTMWGTFLFGLISGVAVKISTLL
jgi:uncharacterized membrane protein